MSVRYGKEVKLGYDRGPRVLIQHPVEASQIFKAKSGCFVKRGSNNYLDIADSGDAYLLGWAETGEFTSSSTAGVSVVSLDISPLSCYWIPADAAVTRAIIGKTCDLIISSNIQYADVGESTEDVIIIEDVDISNQLVLVRMAMAAAREGVV